MRRAATTAHASAEVTRLDEVKRLPLDYAVVEGLIATFECLPVAALLVDANARILLRNARAARCLKGGGGLQERQGRLRCDHVEDSALFARTLEQLVRGASDAPVALSVRRSDGQRALELLLRTTPGGESVAVFLSDREQPPAFNAALAKKLYGLSERELEVAREIAAGKTLAAVAAALRVERETVRSHLKQLFSKTQTARQADLVRLLSTGLFAVGVEP